MNMPTLSLNANICVISLTAEGKWTIGEQHRFVIDEILININANIQSTSMFFIIFLTEHQLA